jgi:hypothetical protein
MGLNNFTTATKTAEFADVDLDSANFPSGFTIDEDGGDLVVRDTTGTVALRRVDGGNWSFAGNTVEANQLGTTSNPVDVEGQDINSTTITNSGQVTTQDLTVNGSSTGVGQDLQACRIKLSSDVSIVAGTQVKVPFDLEVFDSDNNYSLSADEWVCPKDGIYSATFQARFDGGGTSDSRRMFVANSSTQAPSDEGAVFQNRTDRPLIDSVSTTNFYNAGDTIAFYVQNDTNADNLASGGQNFNTFAEVAFLGSL